MKMNKTLSSILFLLTWIGFTASAEESKKDVYEGVCEISSVPKEYGAYDSDNVKIVFISKTPGRFNLIHSILTINDKEVANSFHIWSDSGIFTHSFVIEYRDKNNRTYAILNGETPILRHSFDGTLVLFDTEKGIIGKVYKVKCHFGKR